MKSIVFKNRIKQINNMSIYQAQSNSPPINIFILIHPIHNKKINNSPNPFNKDFL